MNEHSLMREERNWDADVWADLCETFDIDTAEFRHFNPLSEDEQRHKYSCGYSLMENLFEWRYGQTLGKHDREELAS